MPIQNYEIKWYGDAVEAKLDKVGILAVNEVMPEAVQLAKGRVHVDTGELQDSIRVIKSATVTPKGIVGEWGSKDVGHAIPQEVQYPYLRPAADSAYGTLAKKMQKHFGKVK